MKPDSKRTFKTILVIFASILFYVALENTEKVSSLFSYIGNIFTPIFIGIAFAFIFSIPLNIFENKVFGKLTRKNGKTWKKLKRPLCLLISVLIVVGVLTLVLLLIIPEVKDTVIKVAENLPSQAEKLANNIQAWLSGKGISVDENKLFDKIDWQKISESIISGAGSTGNAVLGITSDIVGAVFDTVVGIAISIYILSQKEKLANQAKRLFAAILPEKYCTRLSRVFSMSCDAFSHFVAGQLTEACILGTFCYLGMLLFRMPYAVMVSATIALTALIPVFGAIVGTSVGAFMILLESPVKALGFVIFIIVLQQIDNNFVYPRVVGTSVGLPGIWVLISVTVAGAMFGAIGMLVCVPVCAVCYALIREFVNKKTEMIRSSASKPNTAFKDGNK